MRRAWCAWVAVAGYVLLAGCASPGTKATPTQTVETICASVSAAVKTLSLPIARSKLTPAAQRSVSAALAVVTPICTAPTPPTSLTQIQTTELQNAALTLQTLATFNTSPSQ